MSMNTSLSRSQPFANPYTMANNNDNSAERNVSTPFHNVGVEDNVEGLACDYSFAETREVRKLQLLDEYKVTVLKKIKLFLKHTLRAARKGAMAGGITGLTSGAVAAMFTMHISAIPAFTGAGVALGGGIGAGIGAIKGARCRTQSDLGWPAGRQGCRCKRCSKEDQSQIYQSHESRRRPVHQNALPAKNWTIPLSAFRSERNGSHRKTAQEKTSRF